MRPLQLLLVAVLLTSALPAGSSATDPNSAPGAAALSSSSPNTAAQAPVPAGEKSVSPPTGSTPSPASTGSDLPATAPSEPAPAAEIRATGAPAPQVITAQIDPELALRFALLEKTMLAQSQGQAAIYSETTRLLMFFGSACVVMGLVAMIAAVFLMNRTLASVSAITVQVAQPHGSATALSGPPTLLPGTGAQASGLEKIQASGQRFQGRMTSLEQRLEELETLAGHSAPTAQAGDSPAAQETPAEAAPIEEPAAPRRAISAAAIHVRKSETLMHLGKLNEAMAALDEAAGLGGDQPEIHLARGRILEKLGRLGDALDSYDRAVSNDQTNTAALLMKAGVLNRQERFDEALACYERALAVSRAAA